MANFFKNNKLPRAQGVAVFLQKSLFSRHSFPGQGPEVFRRENKIMILPVSLAALFFGFAAPVLAAELVVDFETTPLFKEGNFLPGNNVSRRVTVTNNDTANHPIDMKFYGVSDPDGLAAQFTFTIKDGATVVYGGKLSDAMAADEIRLSDSLPFVSGSNTADYDFIVAFNEVGGNDYQGKTMEFNLCVGFHGDKDCIGDSEEESQNGGGGMTLTSISGGGRGGDRAPLSLKYFDYEVKTYCLGDGTAMAMFSWKTDAPATGRALHAPANSAKFDPALPDFGYQATKWETKPVTEHTAFAFGLFPVQTYDWRLDMTAANSRRVTTQSLGTFTAPACVLGASDEKDIIEDVMGVSTGVLGEMTDEEIKRFMADLRAQNQNSDDDQSGNKIAAASFVSTALAAPVSEAQNSSQNSTTANYGAITVFALLAMGLVGWFLAKRLNR